MDPLNAVTPAVVEPDLWLTLLKSFGMLSLVIGILIVFLYIIKRLSLLGGLPSEKNLIKMLASYNIAPRERIVLMDVLGEKVLLGVTPQNINCLTVINSDCEISTSNNDPKEGFAKLLKGAIGRGSGSGSGEKSDKVS